MIPQLWDFQDDMVARIYAARQAGARIIVVQSSTGSGKTTVVSQIVKRSVAKGKKSLLIAHMRKLVDQLSERLIEFEIDHGVIMANTPSYSGAPVQVASRDTLSSRVFRNEWTGLPPADLIVVDEAHVGLEPEGDCRRILAAYPQATILLVSATPVGADGRGLGPFAQSIVCGPPTSQLIERGFLVPVKCYAPDRKVHRGQAAKRGIAGDLVQSWKDFAENKPTVLFCSRVEHSKDAVKAYRDAGIPFAHVDADTKDEDRDEIFRRLETGELKGVSNVGIVKIGTDIPCLKCCQIYMDMSGRTAFLQAIGRIMRKYKNRDGEWEKHGILIDHAGVIFRHGFPDDDTEWTLEGDTDADFKQKQKSGTLETAKYCKSCEMLFKGQACPGCGRAPSKPPRSVFAAPKVDTSDELLVKAEKGGQHEVQRDEKIKHWLRCLGMAANANGTFSKALAVYRQKYSEFPDYSFPCQAPYQGTKQKVKDVYPQFGKRAAMAE